jgi:CPA1 family monovalent cation:H+ antiporter
MEHIDMALQFALLLSLGVFCQWLAWRMRLPAILPLLLAGLLLGPVAGVLDPDKLLGDLLFPFISLGVAIILFEGSLTLRFSEIRNVTHIIRNLTSIGVLITWGTMGAAAHYLAGLSWSISLLFGALVSVTGPTVIMPMLRSIRPSARIANVLRWEGILVDPIGAVLAVLLFEFMVTGHQSESLLEFLKVIVMGTVWGVAGGASLGYVLKNHSLPDYLQNYAALAAVLLVFTSSNALGNESGLIAVTVMGIALANMKDVNIAELLSFKEHLTVVLISVLFVLLAARIDFELVRQVGIPALWILGVAVFIARPLSVLFSSIGTSINLREIALLSWVAPRGIVAAAISSLFALKLESQGIVEATQIVPLTFVMIIGTVVIYGLSSGWVAERLGLSSRAEQGVLITSANKVSLMIGEALKNNDIKVKMVDVRRDGLQEARMLGLDVFYGNPLSEFADLYMDLTGYTHLLAMSRNEEANAIVCDQYRPLFGPKNVFSISKGHSDETDREALASGLKSLMLFSGSATWSKLASLIGQGGVIKSTPLSEEYDYLAHQAKWGSNALSLFAIDEKGKLHIFASKEELLPAPGWVLISLVIEQDP